MDESKVPTEQHELKKTACRIASITGPTTDSLAKAGPATQRLPPSQKNAPNPGVTHQPPPYLPLTAVAAA